MHVGRSAHRISTRRSGCRTRGVSCSPRVASQRDAESAEIPALESLIDLRGLRVLEIGSGEGRQTFRYAGLAASVLAIEPDANAVATAQAELPSELRDRVAFRLQDVLELDEPADSFDVAFLSWSL
jgi:cyclopropane fatty-acyl-phospholipid synthase-like methyltransferase